MNVMATKMPSSAAVSVGRAWLLLLSGVSFQQEKSTSGMSAAHREKLMSDLRTVIADAEEVLKVTADQATAGASELRVRMQERLHQAKGRLLDLQENASPVPVPPATPPTTTFTTIRGVPSARPPARHDHRPAHRPPLNERTDARVPRWAVRVAAQLLGTALALAQVRLELLVADPRSSKSCG